MRSSVAYRPDSAECAHAALAPYHASFRQKHSIFSLPWSNNIFSAFTTVVNHSLLDSMQTETGGNCSSGRRRSRRAADRSLVIANGITHQAMDTSNPLSSETASAPNPSDSDRYCEAQVSSKLPVIVAGMSILANGLHHYVLSMCSKMGDCKMLT